MADIDQLLKAKPCARFLRAWKEARGDKSLPMRSDITLRRFARYIPDMAILELTGERELRYRQIGEGVRGRLQIASPGADLTEFYYPDIIDRNIAFLRKILSTPCGAITDYSNEYPGGMVRHSSSITLPIEGDKGEARLLVGVGWVRGERFRTPRHGQAVVGEYLCRGHYFDIGAGVPIRGWQDFLPATSDPDFLAKLTL